MIVITILILLISLILEGIVPNIIKDFISLFLLAAIVILSTLNKNKRHFYLTVFIIGIIYDLTYTSGLFLNAFILLFMSILSNLLIKKNNFIKMSVCYLALILIYLTSIYLTTFFYHNFNILTLLNKLLNSLLLNYLYFIIIYLFIFVLKCFTSNRLKKYSY